MQQNNTQFDQSNVDWYEVDQQGEPKLSLMEKLKPKMKPVIIGILAVISILIIALLVFAVIRLFYSVGNNEQIAQNTELYIEACQNEKDIQKCVESASLRLAQQTGDSKYCSELTGEKLDSCLNLSALTSLSLDDCSGISDENIRNNCNDAVLSLSMTGGFSYEDCSKYSDDEKIYECQQSWIFDRILNSECDYPQIAKEDCESGAIISEAITKQDPDVCGRISHEGMHDRCVEMTAPGDRDFDGVDSDEEVYQGTSDTDSDSDDDGLMDGEELSEYSTDPVDSDTDGDGYLDGEEVLSGHDPLK